MRHPGTPAPLNYRRPSAFSAACPGCGRTLLGLLAALSASLPAVFAAVTVVVLVSLFPATVEAQGDPEEPCPGGGYNPTPVAVAVTAVPIVVASTTADYFVLYVRHTVDGSEVEFPVLVKRGEVDTTTLAENVAALPKERYRVEKYLIADPADVDGDCIDDLTELTNLGSQNPVNPAAGIALTDGAVAIPDEETFTALSEVFASRSGGWTHVVKFFLGDTDTDRPLVYFMNTSKHPIHQSFIDAVGPELGRHTSGKLTYHPELVAPDGSQGLYYFSLNNLILPAFSHAERSYTQLAASMRLLDDNLAVHIPNRWLSRVQSDLQFFRASRMHLVFDEDLFSETDFQALNPGEGYGRLRALEPDERPHPRDIVLYEALPNELPRVAGIISTVPQTPLSHINLRAVQDRIPNAFIRNALDKTNITSLLDNFVRYEVTETGWELRAATKAEVDAHYESSRPAQSQTPQRDLKVTTIKPLSEVGFADWKAFGVKAANVAVLGMLGFPTGTVPTGFAIPFYFYDEFMKHNDFYTRIDTMLADPDFQSKFDTQEKELRKLRKVIKDADTPAWITTALTTMHATFPEGQSLRYRSSTNNEDLPRFNGAGLYDSKTQHPEETEEDGIDKSLKQVFASLWNFRAFTEREFHRIDHMAAMMGVLVHPNYSDELVNGVAASFDPIRGQDGYYYVNSQVGEDLVTNPEPHSVPEELLLSRDTGRYFILSFSNLVEPGELLLSDAQVRQLRQHLTVIHDHFKGLYKPALGEPFAMEIEFKITSEKILAIKQARPWVFDGNAADEPAVLPPMVTIAAKEGASSVTEGTAAEFTLTRGPPTAAEMTVKVTVTQRGAVIQTANSYQPPEEVTFTAGDARATLTVLTDDDEQQQEDGAVIATLQPGEEYRLGESSTQSARVTVRDNEVEPPPPPPPPPVLTGATVNGSTLVLTYDEALDGGSRPVSGDFTVSGGDRVRAVTGVRVNGSGVELTLDVGAEHGEAGILVSYTVPTGMGANPIRDVLGNDAEALSRESVTNETPDTTSPEVSILAISSNPGSDRTYAAGDEIEVTVTFSETVEVEGTPQLRLRVGSRTRTAGYLRGPDTAALVFGYELADGDEDTDGVSIEAGRIALNGGTIKDEADNNAVRVHGSVATQAGHKVDGVRPAFVSAAVDGASLTLTYGEALDGGSRPAPGDFTVEVDGAGRSVSGVSVSGSVVILTLNPAVEHGDTGIRVSYTPGTNPLRDAVGNDALGLSNRSVTNTTGAPNTAPQITSPSSFDVPENQAMVRRLAARDTDPGDEVTGWAIVGGTDRGQFAITSDTGDLSFRTAPDFEAPGDNAYEVTVEVRSGAAARELEAEQTFTLTVTDEREPPGIPEAPTFSGETADSLTVNWSEPDNTGPAISDYDVQYREKGTGGFIDGQHEGPGLSLRLDDLEPGTVYEVQLRATNDEGTGNWSESEEGMTVTPLTVQMTSDLPPPVEGPFTVRFSYSEPVTGFSSNDIESGQNPACSDDQNNPVFCDPGIGRLDTVDNRVFTATVTPGTNGVAHNYTLTLTVSGGAVRSSAGNKPNEAATLEVRIAPPGVTAPISTIGLRASPGNGQVTLRWNTPANTGGAPIVRYEYRWKESGGEFSDWISVGSGTRSATVRNLTNGAEYTFEARAVNALGKGSAETAVATPTVVTRPPVTGGGGGGGGSGRARPPSYPGTIQAEGGDGEVTLRWDAPSSQGSSRIQHYEYRIDGEGEWISTGSTDRIHTITGLTNGRVYFVHLRAVSAAGAGSHRISPEATPVADLDFTHFANGGFITSTLALVNAGAYPVRPAIYFYDQDGDPIAARSLVSLTPDLEVGDDGALSPRTVMNPLGELTIATHGRGGQRVGSVTVRAASSIGGVLRFDIPGFGVAGVGDSPTLRDALVPVRRQNGGINTGVAVRNRGTATLTLQCRLMRDGAVIEEADIRLEVNGQDSRFIDQVFPAADTSDFAGSVRCAAPEPGRFSAVAFELDAVNRIFTTLPVVPVPAVPEQEQAQEEEQGQEQEEEQDATRLDFTHFANGGKIVSSLVLVNAGANPVRPAIYFYDQDGGPIAAESMLDVPANMEIGDDGALRPAMAIDPLGELTISTHGRGVLKVGSVTVTAGGPIGGVLRFDIPALGVAGVGDSAPVRDALVPVRRQDGGINTGVAVHNRGTTALLVRCRLMRAGAVLEETMIPLAANGQDSRFIDQVFPAADTSDFVGSVRCLTPEPGLFSAVAFELDGVNRVFTTLPVVPVVDVP